MKTNQEGKVRGEMGEMEWWSGGVLE